MTSGARICGYLFASCGPTESTKDVVFGGHLIAAENGRAARPSRSDLRSTATRLIAEFDRESCATTAPSTTTFAAALPTAAVPCVDTGITPAPIAALTRSYPRHPFVPSDEHEFDARASEILAIQATGLARRQLAARQQTLVIGLSGGLDSTLAFLVCLDALAKRGRATSALHALTMPGPGTSAGTLSSARALATAGGATLVEIPIDAAVKQHLADLETSRRQHDVVFENAQARERTQLLFNYANKVGGIVVGTGDLSELALGWCTFNGDHMANYNVNASVPKTMIALPGALVRAPPRARSLAKVLRRGSENADQPRAAAARSRRFDQPGHRIDRRPVRAARLLPVSLPAQRLRTREDLRTRLRELRGRVSHATRSNGG